MSEETEEQVEENVESKARALGWVPQEEFHGDPEKWKPADQFIEDGEKINAILKDRIDKLYKNQEMTAQELRQARETMQRMVNDFEEQKNRAVAKERERLLGQRREAISEGDVEKVERIDREIQQTQAPPELKIGDTPEFHQWCRDNPWYSEENRDLFNEAQEIGADLINSPAVRKADGSLDVAKWLSRVEKGVKRAYPEFFKNPNRDEPGAVDNSSTRPNKKGKTFADLPPEAKAAFEMYKKEIPNFTKEQYLELYEWEE